MMKKMAGVRTAIGCLLGFVALAWACGGPPGEEDAGASSAEGSAAVAEAGGAETGAAGGEPATDTARVQGTGPAAAGSADGRETGAEEPLVEEPPRLRTYRVRLVNPSDTAALVYASAGAEAVLLDTVPPRDSVRVDVEVRAERLQLEATDASGEPRGSGELELDPDVVVRWEVPPPSEAAPSEPPPSEPSPPDG